MHQTKSYYRDFFKYGAISKSHPCKADVMDVQLKQSNFMTSVENENKYLYETEHLQVCPERAYEIFTSSQRSVHSNSAFRKHELAASWKNVDILNLAHRIYLHPPSVLTSIGSLDLYEDYLLKDLARVFQLNQLARSNKDLILQDGQGQPGPKAKERRGGNRSYKVQTGMYSTPETVIMTLQIPNYTVCLNLFENHLAHAFYHTFDLNLFIGH